MCPDLFLLSAIACQLAEQLTTEQLNTLSANLVALGDMLAVINSRQNNS